MTYEDKITRSGMFLSIAFLLSGVAERASGFLTMLLLVHFFGASAIADIFVVSTLLPLFLTNILSEVSFSALLPSLPPEQESTPERWERINLLLWSAAGAIALICAALYGIAPFLVRLGAPGYAGQESLVETGCQILRWSTALMGITAFGTIVDTILLSLGYRVVGPLRRGLVSMAGVATGALLLCYSPKRIEMLIVGPVFSAASGLAVGLILLIRGGPAGFLRQLRRAHWPWIAQVLKNAGHFGSTSFLYFGILGIERAIATGLSSGSASAISYVRAYVSLIGIAPTAIANGLFPTLVSQTSHSTVDGIRSPLTRSYWTCAIFGFPLVALCSIANADLLQLLFGRKQISSEMMTFMGKIGLIILLGFTHIIWLPIALRYFQARRRHRLISSFSIVSLIAYAAIAWLGSRLFGAAGLVIAYTATLSIATIFLLFLSIKENNLSLLPSWRLMALSGVGLMSVLLAPWIMKQVHVHISGTTAFVRVLAAGIYVLIAFLPLLCFPRGIRGSKNYA